MVFNILSAPLKKYSDRSIFLEVTIHCLISSRKGPGTSLQITGLATVDPHSHKVQTKLHKIPKFGVNRPNSKQDTAI